MRGLFHRLRTEWGEIPFEVVNDGEVTALAGAASLGEGGVLGISMGTSQAGGYVTPAGNITTWLNELAFAPVDYRDNGPVDEWSVDAGCGVQYFSQQGIARLLRRVSWGLPSEMKAAAQLEVLQERISAGDPDARKVYQTVGTCFGYAIGHYADFYEFRHVLVLGRVTSGEGGDILLRAAQRVLKEEFPQLSEKIQLAMPDEHEKRHGQAVAAAGLPPIGRPALP